MARNEPIFKFRVQSTLNGEGPLIHQIYRRVPIYNALLVERRLLSLSCIRYFVRKTRHNLSSLPVFNKMLAGLSSSLEFRQPESFLSS